MADPKHGRITTPSGFVDHTTETWLERPKCPGCGHAMAENDSVVNEKILFRWWCDNKTDCQYARQASETYQEYVAETKSHVNQTYARYGISPLFDRVTLDTFQGSVGSVAKLRQCIQSPFDVMLTGKPGTGKTHLATAVLKQIIDNGTPQCYFVSIPVMVMQINEAYRDDIGQSPQSIINRMSSYKVIVLDDLGAEKATENVKTVVYQIINDRLERQHPTIITTNCGIGDIASNYNERIASRLKSYTVLTLAGKDNRG